MNRSLAASGQVLARTDDVIVAIEPRVVGLEVAAAMYGISADEIARLQDDEGFPVVRIGRRRLVHIESADTWFAARVRHQWAA